MASRSSVVVIAAALAVAPAVLAQTAPTTSRARQADPRVPAELQAAAVEAATESDKRSDAAWAAAQPAMKADEANGRYYYAYAAVPGDLPQAGIPAFPGAEGGGMYSHGGRGGKVFVVTSLDDRGPGTFREACEAGGARVIVFNVAGVIHLKDRIRIRAPYVTIAGNKAPGDGVCIAGNTVEVETHDVVIRHVRFRRGETFAGDKNDSLGGNPIGNVIVDHVSASWGLDESLSMYRHLYDPPGGGKPMKLATVNITIQNSIAAETLNTYGHAFGSTIGGYNSTFARNLWANNVARNPSIGMDGDFTAIDNVVYNWAYRSADGGDNRSIYTFVNNYYKPGPATREGPLMYRILKPEPRRGAGPKDFGKAYVAGNVVEGNDAVTADNWAGGVQLDAGGDKGTDRPVADVLKEIRLDAMPKVAPVTITSAEDAYAFVLDHAGATLPRRDAVDARIVNEARTGKPTYGNGIITDVAQVGGYPDYKGQPFKDSDGDGMPDEYETAHGLHPNDASDASKVGGPNDYSNIEKYLYDIDPAKRVDWTDPKNNVDTLGAASTAQAK